MKEVYRIDSIETGKLVFVAAWEESRIDWEGQLKLLRKGIHPHKKVQDHFNKYGEDDLKFTLVKKVGDDISMRNEINKCKIEKEVVIKDKDLDVVKTKEIEPPVKDIKPPVKHRTRRKK